MGVYQYNVKYLYIFLFSIVGVIKIIYKMIEIVIYSILEPFLLNVNYYNSILDIKNMIFYKIGISPNLQDLSSSDKIMNDDYELKDYNIRPHSKLLLVIHPLEIQIKTITNQSLSIKAMPYEKICFIKYQIQKQFGIPKNQQRLLYNNKHMKDEDELSVIIEKNPKFLLFLNCPHIKILIKIPLGNTLVLDVATEVNINYIKQIIKNKVGIKENNQELIFGNTKLEDTKKISDYKIVNESILHLSENVKYIKIFIETMMLETYGLDVNLSDTIANVKAKIQALENISVQKQILIFSFQQLDDDKTIKNCNIFNGSVIYLVEKEVS